MPVTRGTNLQTSFHALWTPSQAGYTTTHHTPHMCQKCVLFPVGLTHLVVLDQPLVPCDPVVPQAMAPGLVLTACNLDLILLLEDGPIHEDGGVQKHRECLTLKVLADEGEGDIDSAVRQAHALIKHNLNEEEGWV